MVVGATKRRWVKEAFAALESAGYSISSGYTAVLNPERAKFMYGDSSWSGADLRGRNPVGVFGESKVGGVHMPVEGGGGAET